MKPSWKKSALVATLLASAGVAQAARITFDEGLDTSQAMFAPFITQDAVLYQAGFVIAPIAPGGGSGDLAGVLIDGSDLAATCADIVCPTNNTSTFYAALDDSAVYIGAATSGIPFVLSSFKASFLGNGIDQIPTQGGAGLLQVMGVLADGSGTPVETFVLAPASGEGLLSFSSFSPAFATKPLIGVVFTGFYCGVDGNCSDAFTNNKAQFALDDIELSAMSPAPEPATWAMAALGLAGLAVARRRRPA